MEDKIKELYELIPEGYFNSEQELRDYITDENKLKEVYEFIPKDYFKDLNEYVSYFGETLKKKGSSQGSSPKEFTSPSTSQERLLKTTKTPIIPIENVDSVVQQQAYDEQKWHTDNVKLWLASKPLKKSQEQWTSDQRQKVREYNGVLYDIMQTTQESDVNHYLNVIKSPQMKALTSTTDKLKEEKLSLALTNKLNRVKQLNKELQKESIITDDELKPIENDPMKVWDTKDMEEWDKKLNISLGRWLNMAVGGSVLGMAARLQMPDELKKKEIQESIDIQANYNPSKMEELTATGFGFLMDAPLFQGLGGIFGSLSSNVVLKLTTKSALNLFTGELMAKGLTRRTAQGIALNGFGKAIHGGLASGGTLGAYGGMSDVLSQYKEAYANGEDLDVYDWARTLERIGTDVLMGMAVGVISPIFANTGSKVDMMVDKAIANGIATKADKFIASRINRSLEFATESAVFAAVPAALEGRIPTSQEIMNSAAMLAVIKGANYPAGKIQKIPNELQGRMVVGKTEQKVEFTVRERALLGLDKPEFKDKPFNELPDEVIKRWENDRNIPLLTKYKVMLNGAGIAPVGLVVPDAVRIERETTEGKDRYVVRTYTKTDGEYEYELLSEKEFNDKRIAEASVSQLLDALWDAKVGEVVSNLDVRKKGMLSTKLQELPNKKEVLDAYLLVPELRNEKEKQLAQKFYDAVDEVTGIGRNAYESKLMDDSFGTEKLHLKKREISPKKEEVASEPVQEEKGLKGAEADEVEGLINRDIKQMDEALASTEESSLADAREYDKEMDALDGELAKRVKNERIDALESELMDVESVERETEIKNELRTLYAEKNAKRTSLIGEIKAETPEVVSEPIQEGKVAEMPTTEAKKADIERRRQEELSQSDTKLLESGIEAINNYLNNTDEKLGTAEAISSDGMVVGIHRGLGHDIEGSHVRYNKNEWNERRKLDAKLKAGIITKLEHRKLTDELNRKVLKRGIETNEVVKSKKELNSTSNINTNYDAELAVLKASEMPTTEAKKEESSVIAAPYYDTVIENVSEAQQLRQNENYKAYIEKTRELATKLGLEVVEIKDYIGGFVNTEGKKITEISNEFKVKGDIESAEKFAAILGTTTPDTQESTIVLKYLKEGETAKELVHEYSIKVSDADKTLKSLREAEIFDYSLNESDGTLKLLDFSLGESLEFKNKLRNLLVELKKEGVEYGEQTKRDIDSRYIDPGRRGEILEGLAGDAEFLRQGGGSLREVVEQSRQRHKEYTERVSNAKKTREEVEVQSQEEGIKREEGGQVRVRESAENRLETETGKIDEEKGQREGLQVRTWAYEIDDVVEMSIDIESMGREAAKEKVQEYKAKVDNVRKTMQDIITQNRSTLDKISPEYTKHLLRQVANAKPTNLKNTAQRIESIISNAQTQSKLEKAFKQRKKIKEALRNNPEYASFVRSLNVKAKAKDGGKNLAVEFNKVKVESLPEGLVEDYINVVDNLTSKTPNAGMVEDFMKRYSTEIKREAEKASIPNFDPLKTAESLSKQAQELVEGVDMAQATPEAIMSLKRRLSGLLNHAEYLRKQGVMEMTEEDLKEFSQAEDGIKNYIENIIPKVSEEVKGKIEKLEREYKKTAIDNITGRIGNISLLDALDAEKASKVSAILGKLSNDDVSLSRLSLNDLEKLSASLDIMEETGVSPVVLNEVYTKARGIDRARKARGSVFEAIKEKIATRDHVKKLFAKGEDSVQRRMAGKPDWATSALFDIGKRVSGMYSNPIYNDITHVGSEAINTSEKFIKAQVTRIYSVFNKDRQNLFKRYVYDYGVNRKEMKPFDKVGILMAQVRVANLMKNYRGRVVARGGMFYTVDVEGNPYRVDGKIKVFKTAEEALDFVKSQPIDKLSNGRELDFFDIVNYDYKEGERVYSAKRKDAKLSNDDKQNEKEKKFMEEAYDELVGKNGGKLNNIRTEEDAKKLLTPEEIKYWDAIREVYASTESMAGEVAANEGLVLNGEDFYFPMNSKNMSDRAYDQSATLEDIYSQAVQGKSLRVTDNILKKTQRMNYIDFNALRATEKYVRDMSMSYHVLPAMREQVDALNYLVKEYKESDPELASFAKALRRNIVDGYRIEYTRSSMWGNQKLWIRNSSVDVSKMAKALSNAARNLALNKLERFPLDFFPNSIKMGTAAFKPVDKAAWNQFYQYNPGVAGAKGVAEMQYGRNVIGDYNEIASKGVLQEFSDNWIEKGDRVSRQNTWANKFPEVYKKISGKEFDLEKYNSDVNYRNSVNNSEEFEQAKAITDSYIDETLVPTNKYSNRKQMNSLLWTLSSKSRAYNFLNAMSSYTANENAQGFVYFNEAKYNRLGNQGTQNVARMGRLLMSNMAFQVLSQLGYNTSLYLAGLGSDDEKLKEIAGEGFRGTFDTTNLYANGFMSILSVMMGGYMNLGRYMMSLMYNGAKSGIAYSGDDKWRNKVQKYTKSIEQSMGASRVIDPNIDVTKDYTKTEALLNIIVPFYGKKGLEIIKSGVEIPKQGYNYFSMKFAEDQWMKDPYESGEMIRALNVTIGSLINPAVSTMDVGIRNAIKEEFVNRVPADLVDEIIYMEDFELTYKDARQRLSDKYDQVYKYLDKKNKVGGFSIDLYGNKIINEYSAIGSIKDPETFASEKAGKAFSEYLDKGENRKLYDFYDINKDQIDELIATTRAIIKDKKMGKEEREAKYDIIRKEVENLKYAYGQFKKGEMKGSVYITGKDLMNMNVNDMLRKIERKALKEFRIDEEKLNGIK